MLADATVNGMLDNKFPSGAGNVQLSLHSAYSTSGANLVGSKTSANFAAASARSKALSASCSIAVPSANTVAFIGAWDSAGTTFLGMFPNGSPGEMSFQIDDTNDKILCENHGLANGDRVTFTGGTPPGGLTEGTIYYVVSVVSADPDTFQVSATSGGSAITLTGQPTAGCQLSKVLVDVYSGSGTHTVSALSITL
jgi:hypothetical protein